MVGMPPNGKIRIYTVAGLLVWEGPVTIEGTLEWDGRNQSGQTVVPGVYMWIALDGAFQRRQRGRLIVEY